MELFSFSLEDLMMIRNVNDIIRTADVFIYFFFLCCVSYLFLYTLMSIGRWINPYPIAKKKHKFLIVYALEHSERAILFAVQSMFEQNYPKELFDINVIATTMPKDVLLKLEEMGAKIILTHSNNGNKMGYIQQVVKQHQYDNYQMVVLMDKDNRVDIDFLQHVNDAFYSGCMAIQAHRTAFKTDKSSTVLSAVSEEINNSIFRKGHVRLGLSSALLGSGMAFDFEWFINNILDESPTDITKLLEIKLLKQNIYIDFLDSVYVYDDKVIKKTGFYRSFLGDIKLRKQIGPGLLALFKGNLDFVDKVLQWIIPSRILLCGYILLGGVLLFLFDWTLSVKWFFLLFFVLITFTIAIPKKMLNSNLRNSLWSFPFLIIVTFIERIATLFKFSKPKKNLQE